MSSPASRTPHNDEPAPDPTPEATKTPHEPPEPAAARREILFAAALRFAEEAPTVWERLLWFRTARAIERPGMERLLGHGVSFLQLVFERARHREERQGLLREYQDARRHEMRAWRARREDEQRELYLRLFMPLFERIALKVAPSATHPPRVAPEPPPTERATRPRARR